MDRCGYGPLHAEGFEPVCVSEGDTLRPLAPNALSAVRTHVRTTHYRDCEADGYMGSAVGLAGHVQPNHWIAKTAVGCAWGAASVVIWVLMRGPTG